MSQKVASLYAELTADTTGLDRGLAKAKTGLQQTSQSAQTTAKSFSAVGNAAKLMAAGGLASAGVAMVNFGKQAITAASNVEEAASKFGFVFGPAAESAGAALDEFASAVGRSRYELRETAAGFGGILEGMLGSKEAAADMSVELAKLTTDLASFYNVAESDAAMALTSGLVGETEPMRRFGVLLNEASVQAEIFASGMATTKGEITEAMKVQARMNIIMAATATAQGDAARTSESYSNQQRDTQAAVLDLSVAIGQNLLPVATALTGVVGAAAEQLTIFFDIAANGGEAVETLASVSLEAADSTEELTTQLGRAAEAYELSRTALGRMTGTQDEVRAALRNIIVELAASTGGYDEFTAAINEAGITITDAANILDLFSTDLHGNTEAWYANAKAAEYAAQADANLSRYILDVKEATVDSRTETEKASDAMDAMGAIVEDTQTSYANYVFGLREAEAAEQANAAAVEALKESHAAAAAAIQATETALRGYFDAALMAEDAIFSWSESVTVAGGRTSDQSELLRELQAEYDKVSTNLRSYESGVKGIGLTEEERNKKIEESVARLGELGAAIEPLAGIQGVVTSSTAAWTINTEAANQAVYDTVAASGASAAELALLGVALGVISEEAANAALKTALFQKGLDAMAEAAMADGQITRDEIFQIREEASKLLDSINDLPPLVNLEFETNAHEATQAAYDLANAAMEASGTYPIVFDISTSGSGIPGGAEIPGPGGTPVAFSTGGWVYGGTPGRDSVPAMLTPGELVIPRSHARDADAILDFARANGVSGGSGVSQQAPPVINITVYGEMQSTPEAIASKVGDKLSPRG